MTQALVIGGGIAGLSAGAALSQDLEVTILEAENALGYHTSGRSAALTEQNYGAASVRLLNRASFEVLQDGGYLSPRGLMIVSQAHEGEAFERDVASMGLGEITPSDAIDMVPVFDPSKLHRAAYHADAFDIDTDRLLQDYARQVRENGGQVQTGQQVTEIARDGSGWRVTTKGATYDADLLINAAGAWADQIAQHAGIRPIGLQPLRRSMARIPPPDDHDVSHWPMFFGVGESWYAKPDAGALIISPAEEDPAEPHDAYADDMVLAEGIARYQEMVTPEVTRMLSNWAGLRSFASDRTLVLGPDPDVPSFIWCAGQGGYGFQTAPAAAKFLADCVLDRPVAVSTEHADMLKPDRLR